MTEFKGTGGTDQITPDFVSPGVKVTGRPAFPSAAVDVIVVRDGDDTVAGGGGDDRADLGRGDDRFVWDLGDGSDTVLGKKGFDTLEFNGSSNSENIDISAHAGGARVFQDVANITMTLDGVERIEFAALGGADNIVVNDLSGTATTVVAIDLAPVLGGSGGDGQVDQVTVRGTNGDDVVLVTGSAAALSVQGLAAEVTLVNGEAGLDRLVIDALAGDDVVDASGMVGFGVRAFGGAGDDVLIGGNGVDVLDGGAGDDVVIGGAEDMLTGGDGDDIVIGGSGNSALRGEAGADLFRFGETTGNGVAEYDIVRDFDAAQGDRLDLGGGLMEARLTSDGLLLTLGGADGD